MAHSACDAQRHGTRKTRREPRDDRRSSFMHRPELPDHAADHPTPSRPPHPRTAVRGAQVRSSQLQLHVARRRRGSPARSPASPLRWCSSAPPSRRSPERFCIMLTGSALSTGIAAPHRMHALVEQPGRPEIGRHHEDDDRACCRQLRGLAAASLAERIQKSAWRPSEAMPLRLPGNGVRWMPPSRAV